MQGINSSKLLRLQQTKVETRDHFKNGATPKSQMSREIKTLNKMKKYFLLLIISIFTVTFSFTLPNHF